MKPLCIYHGNCADGFTSAWVVNKYFNGEVDFHAGVHQNAPPDVKDRDVIMVDFSYKRPVLEEIRTSANSVLILDHHKTAEADLKGHDGVDISGWATRLGWQRHMENVTQDDYENANLNGAVIYYLFDMERSGAGLAWDFFMGTDRPALVNYVEDRDLWRFKLPMSREVNAYVFAHEYTFENWDHLHRQMRNHMDVQGVADMGGAIEKKHHRDIKELVGVTMRRMIIGGHDVPVANIPYTMASDAGHLMAETEPFAACYWDTPDGRVMSLRSSHAGMDVSEIAKAYGGGGHARASGFRMPIGWEGDPHG